MKGNKVLHFLNSWYQNNPYSLNNKRFECAALNLRIICDVFLEVDIFFDAVGDALLASNRFSKLMAPQVALTTTTTLTMVTTKLTIIGRIFFRRFSTGGSEFGLRKRRREEKKHLGEF